MEETAIQLPSKAEVVQAGKALRGTLPWTPETPDEHVRVFRVAYDWRNSHQYPAQRIRQELTGKVRKLRLNGITAARTKRMASIRKKLARTKITLAQIQDLGGCRVIVDSIAEIGLLVNLYRNGGSRHVVWKHDNYIDIPKMGGYRGHHFVLEFAGELHEAVYHGRRVELQVRTRLQHAWATAVEAVGMVRGEDLKAGEGHADWLRLFTLMSSEFADAEGCPPVPGTSDIQARREEIRDIDNRISAEATLSKINTALRITEGGVSAHTNFFLVQYDGANQSLRVRGYTSSPLGSEQYDFDESRLSSMNSVMVEVDRAENLREAYPNYFLDVATFADNIMKITGGAKGRPKGIRAHDLSFLRNKNWKKRTSY